MNTSPSGTTTSAYRSPSAVGAQHGVGPVEAFWRFRSWTVPITVVVGVLAALGALATSGTSTATSTLYLTDPRGAVAFGEGSSNGTDLSRYAHQRAEFAQSADVFANVLKQLTEDRAAANAEGPAEDLDSLDRIVASTPTASSDVRVDCTDSDPERALRICRSVVQSYVELTLADIQKRGELQITVLLEERVRVLSDPDGRGTSVAVIDNKVFEIRRQAALFGSGVEFVEPADVEEDSRIAPAIQIGLAGLLFAGFATAALAWFRAGRRPVVSSGSDATAALRAPLLGEIVANPHDAFAAATPPGAAYQLLATSLGAVHPDGGIVLAGTATPSAHASETIARMATASAREGRRVLVVDGDIDGRRISRLFGQEQTNGGLTELLAGLDSFDEIRRTVGVGGAATLDLITGGRPIDDPSSLFRSQQAREIVAAFRNRYDLVLIAIPPLLTAPDGSALASAADGVVVIVDRGIDAQDLDTVRQRLEVLRTPTLGVVFDHRPGDHGR
jgi:polysaccharide biosynthesis transport protein